MSLRMNIYGWSLPAFKQTVGSKDSALLDAATTGLRKYLPEEPKFLRARSWIRTLIEAGYPLANGREGPPVPADGGLVTMQMETELHAIALYAIARAIALPEHLDLATESSNWMHQSIGAFSQALSACGFARSKACRYQMFNWIHRLGEGSPLFGDGFMTSWSFYTIFPNHELSEIVSDLRAAAAFQRPIPQGYSDEMAHKIVTTLSADGKSFANDLIGWMGQIQSAGQDAFIYWW